MRATRLLAALTITVSGLHVRADKQDNVAFPRLEYRSVTDNYVGTRHFVVSTYYVDGAFRSTASDMPGVVTLHRSCDSPFLMWDYCPAKHEAYPTAGYGGIYKMLALRRFGAIRTAELEASYQAAGTAEVEDARRSHLSHCAPRGYSELFMPRGRLAGGSATVAKQDTQYYDWKDPTLGDADTRWYVLRGSNLILKTTDHVGALPGRTMPPPPDNGFTTVSFSRLVGKRPTSIVLPPGATMVVTRLYTALFGPLHKDPGTHTAIVNEAALDKRYGAMIALVEARKLGGR